MNADDLQEIYNAIRGSRSAMPVMDARTSFVERDYELSHKKLAEAYEKYSESRARILKQDPVKQVDPKEKDADKQIRRLERKQEKAKEILAKFEELLPELEKKAKKAMEKRLQEEQKREKELALKQQQETVKIGDTVSVEEYMSDLGPEDNELDASSSDSDSEVSSNSGEVSADVETLDKSISGNAPVIARPESLTESFMDELQANWGDDQLAVIAKRYSFQPVQSIADVHKDALYYLRREEESLLVWTEDCSNKEVVLVNAATGDAMKPLPIEWFLELGVERTMVLLLEHQAPTAKPVSSEPSPKRTPDQSGIDHGKSLSSDDFSELMESVLRSGLIPVSDQIGEIRDREFSNGAYDLALHAIEELHEKFTSAAKARTERLNEQEESIASGHIKISEKQLHAKRARDAGQSQEIDRTERRFARVMEGLRVLLNHENA